MVKVSAIIPCYNEKERLGQVLRVVREAALVEETLVIDDGSTDQTEAFVSQNFPTVTYVRHEQNQGKAAAMCTGITKAAGEIIVFIDADLRQLKSAHVDALVRPVREGHVDMAVLLRGGAPFLYRYVFHSDPAISGERCLWKKDFLKVWELHPDLPQVHYAVEVLLNDYFISRGRKIVVVPAAGVDQTYKEQKENFWQGFVKNLKMTRNLLRYIGIRKYLQQLAFYTFLPKGL